MNHLVFNTSNNSDTSLCPEHISEQIRKTQNMCRFHLYLDTIDTELCDLYHILSRSSTQKDNQYFRLRVISLFSELFIDGIGYSDSERKKIEELFKKAISIYHQLFPNTKGQNYIRGNTPSTLMILGDNGGISYFQAGEYRFI